jgi:plastocyanin
MATYNISVLSTSSSANGYRFSGNDRNGTINSSTNNPTININTGDTINFTFSNSTSHPFTIGGTTISGESATGGYYSTPTSDSYTFSSAMTYTYVCNVHSSMTGSIIAASSSGTTTTTTAAPTTTTTTTTTATTAAPTTTTTTTTTASPTTTTTTTTTTAAPDGTATTTTTASPSLTTTTTTTTLAPSTSDSGWVITGRRSDTSKDASTFFTFAAPTGAENLSIVDVELQTQTVDQAVTTSNEWVAKTPTTKTGSVPAINDPNRRRINNIDTTNLSVGMLVAGNNIPSDTVITDVDNNSSTITVSNAVEGESSEQEGTITFEEWIPPKKRKFNDLPYIDYTPANRLPDSCSTSVFCEFNKVGNTQVKVEGDQNNMRLSAGINGPYVNEARWSANLRQRVIRLKSILGVNEEGQSAGVLVDVPTSKSWSHSVFMTHNICNGEIGLNNPLSAGEADIPPAAFEGGEMNATNSSASMTKANPYSDQLQPEPATILSLTGGGDKEVTVIVTIVVRQDFIMHWKVPATTNVKIDYSGQNIGEYDLYGYSFEVQDNTKGGWRQFAEYTADTPAPSGCEGTQNPKFAGFLTSFGDDTQDRGKDQTVIRGHNGRVYIPGEPLMAVYQSLNEITDFVEFDPSLEKHRIEGVGPVREYIEFDRSPDYTFRVRTIFRRLIDNNAVYIYIDSGNTSTDYAVKQSYHLLGGLYRARNPDFYSTPLEVEGVLYDAFDEANIPIVPEYPAE